MSNADNHANSRFQKRCPTAVRHCKIYRFDNFSEALICISSLEQYCNRLSFTLFFANGVYYLWLCFNRSYRCAILGIVSEFAAPVNMNLRHILREHGEIICRGFYEIH